MSASATAVPTPQDAARSAMEARVTTVVTDPMVEQFLRDPDIVREFADAAMNRNPLVAYHRSGANEIDQQDFTGGSITARSLVLGRFAGVPGPVGVYGPDNYTTCLGLDSAGLAKLQGQKLLDIGCGCSLFPAEAKALFGIDVQGIDLNAKGEDTATRNEIFKQYVKNLVFAQFLASNPGVGPTLNADQLALLNRCLTEVHTTRNRYMDEGWLQEGDALKLPYAANSFDGAVSSWLFMYLTHDQAEKALNEMVRVTKNGGFIRICEGAWVLGDATGKGLTDAKINKVKGLKLVSSGGATSANPGGLRIFQVKK